MILRSSFGLHVQVHAHIYTCTHMRINIGCSWNAVCVIYYLLSSLFDISIPNSFLYSLTVVLKGTIYLAQLVNISRDSLALFSLSL